MVIQQRLLQLTEYCDIFFEDSLISQELIIQRYVDYCISSITSKERSSSVVLHTGSLCFDIVSFIIAALACISADQTDADQVIAELEIGDLVLHKNQRHRWLGLEMMNDVLYMKLEQDGRGQSGISTCWLPFEQNKKRIKPYHGTSRVTDGRGIRKRKSNRSDFIAHITGREESEIPSITGVSAVIVAERTTFDRIQKGVRVEYGEGESIGLLDIVPASYYTDGNEPYQFGSNPSKTEPVLKITGKVSTARDLVLDRYGNDVVGLMVLGSDAIAKGSSELADLLSRKSLKFTHISMDIDSNLGEDYVYGENTTVFACTRDFLLKHSRSMVVQNPFSKELDKQIHNIVHNDIKTEIVGGGCSWETYQEVMNALFVIRQSNWDEECKREFLILAYSLLKLVTTIVFSMASFEQAIIEGQLHPGILPPATRMRRIWELAEGADSLESQCILVASVLDNLYKSSRTDSPKYQALKRIIKDAPTEKVAIIVPKAYYGDILLREPAFSQNRVRVMTANRFDASQSYDRVIVVGGFSGKRFDPLKCRAAESITVLLYEYEVNWFTCRKEKSAKFDRDLNIMNGLNDRFTYDDTADGGETELFVSKSLDLEEYVDNVGLLDIRRFAASLSVENGSAPTSEVLAIGEFVSGEQIIFSKYYKAVVYRPESTKKPVSETDVENLSAGDTLVFARRDDFTKNIVDSVYEALQTSGKLNQEVIDATDKAQWWKEILREYQRTHDLSYRQVTRELNLFGCSLTEVSIRQWLVEESHIVGPREERTLRQIAEMTGDPYLLDDVPGHFNACRIVRAQRRKILELIGKAIEDKLSGHQPPSGSELEIVYNNVEHLSETLELRSILFLDEFVAVPVNLINKPISDMEVA